MKNIAVILAGGNGSRTGFETPKQFFKVAGKTVLEHTLDVFQKHKCIDEIAVVSHVNFISKIEDSVNKYRLTKVKKILSGGSERYLSSWSAIQAYEDLEDCNLIFHDAVRPLVSERIIDDVIDALTNGYEAVDVAIPAVDTIIKIIQEKNEIDSIPNRSELMRGQNSSRFPASVDKGSVLFGFYGSRF